MTAHEGTSAGYPVREVSEDDWPAFVEVDGLAFASTIPDEIVEAERANFEPGRSIAAFEDSAPIGIATAFSFRIGVPGLPGGTLEVPAAGVSWVAVLPTHRRRGVLRSLMTHQLHAVHDAGTEPLAILWASEPPIYGRFGYGLASRAFALEAPRSPSALRTDVPTDPALRLRYAAADDWRLTATVYDAVAAGRPGLLARDERWWARAVRDRPGTRDGRSALRCVVAEDADGVRGYARYSTKPDWGTSTPQGTVFVREMMARDPAAAALIYRFLLDQDLMGTVDLWNVPVDDPLLLWFDNIRAARPRWIDALYVRVVDLAAALQARRYAAPLDVVLDVTDDLCPWNQGRWRLTANGDDVRCAPTDRDPDLALSITDIGAAYLGGTQLSDLAMAGRVTERTPGALAAATTAFRASPAPWCPVVF